MASSVFIGWFGGGVPWSWDGSTATLTGNLTVTGNVTGARFFGDSSATLPAFSITGDTNTGWGASAADTVAVEAACTDSRIISAGAFRTIPGEPIWLVGTCPRPQEGRG